ncbi:MAG: MFS transporter [Novosphingobium sp.]|nr:MFS transporter [Novosphingobium sp.]MCP5402891.1 MFS transporter [Novosphingobium sp.]
MAQPPTAREEWKAHRGLVLAGMLGMSFYSIITYSLGTFIEPLEQEFGWSRAEISLGLTIFTLTATFGGPLIGAVIDRFGTRRVALPGIALHAAAFAAFGITDGSIFQWIVLWSVMAVVALATKGLIWSAAVSSVFTVSRSLALAVMLTGTALGQASPIVANWLIESVGWRMAYVWLGAGWGGLAFILVLLFFFDAREHSRRSGAASPSAAGLPGLTSAEAIRDSRIWRIGLANLAMTFVGGGITVHLVPILSETGAERSVAVAIAASAGIAAIAGKLLAGVLLDRIQSSLIPFTAFALPALGYFLLLDRFESDAMLTLGVMIIGFASGAGFQITTYLVSRYGGLRNFGKIYGTISSTLMLGASLGPLASGMLYDATGSYELLVVAAIPVVLVAALMFVGLGPYPDFKTPNSTSQTSGKLAAAE